MNEEIPMKKTRFTEAQIMGVLRQMEGGVPAAELCREHGMSSATLYKWRAKYGGMDASLISESEPCPPLVQGQWSHRAGHSMSVRRVIGTAPSWTMRTSRSPICCSG